MATERPIAAPAGAGEVVDTVSNEAAHVSEMAREQTRDVVGEAKQEAAFVVHDLERNVRERAEEEASKFAHSLHAAGRQMQTMAHSVDERSLVSGVAREGARAAERLASHIDAGGLERVMADARSYARRNPGGFLLGAAVVGFAVGRVARNLPGQHGGQDTAGTPLRNEAETSSLVGGTSGGAVLDLTADTESGSEVRGGVA